MADSAMEKLSIAMIYVVNMCEWIKCEHGLIGFYHGCTGLAAICKTWASDSLRQNTSAYKASLFWLLQPVPRDVFAAKPSTPWLKPTFKHADI